MIDWARIAELKDEVGAGDFEEVVEMFLEEVEEAIEALTSSPPVKELEALLHALKGSALNLGFADFAAICQSGETAAANADYAKIDSSAVNAVYEASRTAFLATVG